MYYCCKELNLEWKTVKYCLLGDDIVICDPKVATLYKQVITSLGVEFSQAKTYESSHFVEFAKRLFYKGEEISPFPFSALRESINHYSLMVNLLRETGNKGWVPVEGIGAGITSFYREILHTRSLFAQAIGKKSSACNLMMSIIRGAEDAGSLLTEAYRELGFPYTLSSFVAKNILENIAVECFADSNPASFKETKSKRPCIGLGGLAEQLTMILTGLDEERCALGFELIYALPHLNAYGQIEQMYIDLSKTARKISTTGGGDWPLLLKTMALP